QGLGDYGYVEGQTVVIDFKDAAGQGELLPVLAAELVQLQPDVIVLDSGPAAQAAKQATNTIPIVVGIVGDPVRLGLVESLARPGGNLTGLSSYSPVLSPKRLEL